MTWYWYVVAYLGIGLLGVFESMDTCWAMAKSIEKSSDLDVAFSVGTLIILLWPYYLLRGFLRTIRVIHELIVS